MNRKANLVALGVFLMNLPAFTAFASTAAVQNPIAPSKRITRKTIPRMLIKRNRTFDIENKTESTVRLTLCFADETTANYDLAPGARITTQGKFTGVAGYKLFVKDAAGEYDLREAKSRLKLFGHKHSFTIEADINDDVFNVNLEQPLTKTDDQKERL